MLEIQNLIVQLNGKLVIDDVSLQIEAGEVLALVGPNGAGKTTLIRAVSGVVRPESGSLTYAGMDILASDQSLRARLMAVVPQAVSLPGSFSVYQTVLLGRTPYMGWLGNPGSGDRASVVDAMEKTSLSELASRYVGELSGGERQRVLLARALAQDTKILLLDEPTSHLDLQHQSAFLNLVCKLAKEKRLAVILVLHDLNLAGVYADKVAVMVEGKIRAAGDVSSVLTSKLLSEVYSMPVHVISHPEYGTPLILPDGRQFRGDS